MRENPQPSYEQQRAYYDRWWFNWLNRMPIGDDAYRIVIKSNVRKLKAEYGRDLKILDLGCGRGWITHALSKYGEAVGVDLSTKAAEKLYPKLNFIQANFLTDNIPGNYDIVVSTEVIEHLISEDQKTYVQKASALLRERGYLIITTPNRPVTETLFREVPRANKHRQPIENWLDNESLNALLKPDFEIVHSGSVVFCPVMVRRSFYLNALYSLVYESLRLFKVFDKSRTSSQEGLYLTIVARKRSVAPAR